jgi:hypothetical protein
MIATMTTLYESLSVRAASGADSTRTEETKAIETIDRDAALIEQLGDLHGGLMTSLGEAVPRGRDRQTRITATVETIDPDREAMWLAPGAWP